jgi:hypothetical protein
MRSAALALGCLLGIAALQLVGQEKPQASAQHGSVGGIVVNSSGEPVKRAAIQLSGYMNESRFDAEMTTGPDGRFQFKDVPPGEYSVSARRAVGSPMGMDQRNSAVELTLHSGQQLRDLVLKMAAPAVIHGQVVDEDGEPVQGVQVAALQARYVYVLHGRQLLPVDVQTTDDRGEFRLSGLAPGHYLVSAAPGQFSAGPGLSYPSRYYPDALTVDAATPFILRAGDEAEANFTLTPVKAVSVRGRIAYPKNVSWFAMLRPKAGRGAVLPVGGMFGSFISMQVNQDGTFEAKNVAPGTYELTANGYDSETKIARHAETSITVADSDIDGVAVTPVDTEKNLASIAGELRLDRGGSMEWDGLSLTLQPSSAPDDIEMQFEEIGRSLARINKDGTFTLTVPPGTYTTMLNASSNKYRDLYTKSVEYGGHEVTTGFTVSAGGGALRIVVGTDGARIVGSVVDENGKPEGSVQVIAVPEQKYRARYEDYGRANTDFQGQFTLYGLRPGAYLVLAVDGLEDDSYMDPRWLREYEAEATLVRADANGSYQLKLKAISGAEE